MKRAKALALRAGLPDRASARSAQLRSTRPPFTPDPPERLGLPVARAVADPRQLREVALAAGDQLRERAAGEVRRGHPVAHVAARPGDPAAAVEAHGGVPVARHPEAPPQRCVTS